MSEYFGNLLKSYRVKAKLTQQNLAYRLDSLNDSLVVSAQAISYWETGRRKIPDRETLISVIHVLNNEGAIESINDVDKLLEACGYKPATQADAEELNLNLHLRKEEDYSLYTQLSRNYPANLFHGNVSVGGNLIIGAETVNILPQEEALSDSTLDTYDLYLRDVDYLLEVVNEDSQSYREALSYQQMLAENISNVRQHGDSPAARAERAGILAQLNLISITSINRPIGLLR